MPDLGEYSRSYYGWVVVGLVFLAELLAFGLVLSFGVFFKPLASEFHWSRAATAGALSAYAITNGILGPVTGRVADKFGPRVVVAMGGFCLVLAMFLMSRITDIWQFYLFYAVIFSLGVASVYAPLMATVSRWFRERRGLAVGIATAGLGAGFLAFSPLAAWLISSYGWRTAYIVMGAICLVLFIPIVRFMKQAPKRGLEVETEEESSKDFTTAEALRTRVFWMISLAWLFVAIAYWAVAINIVPLLTDMGVSLVSAGIVAGMIGGASMISRVGMGFLSDKIGRKRGFLTSLVVQLGAMILLLFCQELWMFCVFAIILGLGMGGWGVSMPSLSADFFGSKAAATIFGFITIFGAMGLALGPFIGGRIFDVTGSYHYMIWMCIIVSGVAMIFASLIKDSVK